MIIGNGDLASVLPDRDDVIFFASGVSNSQETDIAQFRREAALLLEQDPTQHIVYFSSLAVFIGATQYIQHKRQMETLVNTQFPHRTIVRIGNITWGDNPHTLINHLKAKMEAGEELEIQDTYRYIVDKEEFRYWIDLIPKWNSEMNIPGRRMKVAEVVQEIQEGKI